MKRTIVNKTLSEQIYEELREQIIRGELQPGDRIVELDIAKQFGVSQAPVREAFLKLAEEDLVVSQRNKGSFVSNFSVEEISELYDFRVMMEEFAIKRAFERVTDEDIMVLEDIFNEMVVAGKSHDLESIRSADIKFHSKIYLMANHKFMGNVWDTLVSKLDRIWYFNSQLYFTNLSQLASIHEPMLTAFKQGDLKGCLLAFENHVTFEKKNGQSNSRINPK